VTRSGRTDTIKAESVSLVWAIAEAVGGGWERPLPEGRRVRRRRRRFGFLDIRRFCRGIRLGNDHRGWFACRLGVRRCLRRRRWCLRSEEHTSELQSH
jgi:hypothetical protein